MMRVVGGILMFALAAPAFAAETRVPEATETVNGAALESGEEERRICKRIQATESRLSAKRICMTAAEWRKEQADAQRLKAD